MESVASSNGWLVAFRMQQDDGAQMLRQKLFRWHGDSIEVLASYDFRLRPRKTTPICPGINVSSDQRPLFEPDLLWSTNGSTIAWRGGWSEYRIRVREANGKEREIKRDVPAVSATEQLAVAASGGRQGVVGNCQYDKTQVIRARGWAATRPVIQNLRVLPDGAMWVSRFSARGDTLIDVFDSAGLYAGTLPMGSRMPDAFLAGDRVLYKHDLTGTAPVVRIAQVTKRR
jgi:hypothetical protein